MAEEDKEAAKKQGDAFFDHKFAIEAMQNEPYEDGFTWRTIVGSLFIAFIMLPGIIFMGMMIGQHMGQAADWVVIILFVELARRSFVTLKKQELYILKYTVGQLTSVMGGVMLAGGVCAHLVYNRYQRNSEAFHNFGIAHEVPDWFAPYGDAAYSDFFNSVWWPAIAVLVISMILNKLTQLSLGHIAYKLTSDVEKLPFPLAPIQAEGAIALAESSRDENKKGFRQYCFSIGAVIGAAFGILYVAVPTLSQAFLGETFQLLPIPFLDLTQACERFIPGGIVTISFNLGLIFLGFVLPRRIVMGTFIATFLFQFVINPLLQTNGLLPSWTPGKDAIETQVAATLDVYLSVGIGTSFAIFFFGLFGMLGAWLKYRKKTPDGKTMAAAGGVDIRQLFIRDKERGDPPIWVSFAVWVLCSAGFVALSHYLINGGVPREDQFPVYWLLMYAFFWTPINTYINARMSGIAGQFAGVPFIFESAIFASGHRGVNIWFAPMPLQNYGGMADLLRQTQLTRTKFTSILKAELFTFPLLLFTSFMFWRYINANMGGRIPSEDFPYIQRFWPMFAQMRALWASSMQEGNSLLMTALKPALIASALVVTTAIFGAFSWLGISHQYIYGAIAGINGYPHTAIPVFLGSLLGRHVMAKKFGQERWQNFAPILMVGFGVGIGLTGMLSIAINFLWVSIGTQL